MDASCPQWNAAVKSGTITPPAASSSPVAVAAAAPSLVDVMAFSGAAPEITNGRLAMLGFVSAVAAELSSGEWTRDAMDSCTTRVPGWADVCRCMAALYCLQFSKVSGAGQR
jgi:hypothetical protein